MIPCRSSDAVRVTDADFKPIELGENQVETYCTVCDSSISSAATAMLSNSNTRARHHCRCCGSAVCGYCSKSTINKLRACDRCIKCYIVIDNWYSNNSYSFKPSTINIYAKDELEAFIVDRFIMDGTIPQYYVRQIEDNKDSNDDIDRKSNSNKSLDAGHKLQQLKDGFKATIRYPFPFALPRLLGTRIQFWVDFDIAISKTDDHIGNKNLYTAYRQCPLLQSINVSDTSDCDYFNTGREPKANEKEKKKEKEMEKNKKKDKYVQFMSN